MHSMMNPVNRFSINSSGINMGTLRPSGSDAESVTSLYLIGDDYSFNTLAQMSANVLTSGNPETIIEVSSLTTSGKMVYGTSSNTEENVSFSVWPNLVYSLCENDIVINNDAQIDTSPTMIYSPQPGSYDANTVVRFFSDMDNIFGSIFPFLNESLEYGTAANITWGPHHELIINASIDPHANIIYGPVLDMVDHITSVESRPSMIYGPSYKWEFDAELNCPIIRRIWRNVDIALDSELYIPAVRAINRAVDIDKEISVLLRDWSDAQEKRVNIDIQQSSGMLVDLWIKMYFYPLNNTSSMDAYTVIKHPVKIEDITAKAGLVSNASIKKWVEYIGAEANIFSAPALGVTADVGIDSDTLFSISGFLKQNNNGTIIDNNNGNCPVCGCHCTCINNVKDNFEVNGNVYTDGYLKLRLHTKDCPVYP